MFLELEATPLSCDTFSGQLKMGHLDRIQITEVIADPQHVVRTNYQIADTKEEYFLVSLQTQGKSQVIQDQRESELLPNDFVVYDSTRPYTLHFDQPFHQIVFQFPRTLLLTKCPYADQMTSIRIQGTKYATTSMVSSFLRTVAATYSNFDIVTKMRVAENVLDLLVTAINTFSGDKPDDVKSAADIHRIKARTYISSHLSNPNLTPEVVAKNQGITTRYLHKIFEGEGQTVSSYIRNKRLEQCRQELSNLNQLNTSITDIAFRWGFNDTAHFSRVFKSYFGITPSECRSFILIDGINQPPSY